MQLNTESIVKAKNQTRCVFGRLNIIIVVGNIPYDATEQQLLDTFQLVGPLVSFRWLNYHKIKRLVHDQNTKKPKGFGFCEYKDSDIAASALRNLNNIEFNGRRLRVDYADNDKSGVNLTKEEIKIRDPDYIENINSNSSTADIISNMNISQAHYIIESLKEVALKEPELLSQNLNNNEALLSIVIQSLSNLQNLEVQHR